MTAPQQVVGDPEVAAYARQVREALADVPAARLEELLEDLEEHLVEVAAETPGPLAGRLGPADDYAAELRRAAGLPDPQTGATAVPREPAVSRWITRLQGSAAYDQVARFLPELRPAWWVVRGWAVVAAVGFVFTGSVGVPLPTLGLGVVGWLLTGAAVVWSVRLGLRARAAGQELTHTVAFANLGLAICAVIAVIGVADRAATGSYPEPVSYDSFPTTLTHQDGTPITNIVPYSTDGVPLDGVLLYDQDGRPIDNLSTSTAEGGEVSPQEVSPPQPANAYPQRQDVVSYDEYGSPVTTEFPVQSAAEPTPPAPETPAPTPVTPTPAPATP